MADTRETKVQILVKDQNGNDTVVADTGWHDLPYEATGELLKQASDWILLNKSDS